MEFKRNKLSHIHSTFTVTKAKYLPDGQFEAILSTDDLDRHGEIVSIKGMQIPADQVLKIYYNHETTGASLPIGQWVKIWKSTDGKLKGRGQIDLLDDFEIKIDKKIKLGTLDSISIGFIPQEYDGETSTWTKATLAEASIVAEPANTHARVTQKALGFTEEEFEKSLAAKLSESEHITVKRVVKGAVEDVLLEPKKWELMKSYYDVMYAFEDAYYSDETPATDFNKLLAETIGLLQKIVDGTYSLTGKSAGDESGASTEIKSAIEELKSKVGVLEEAHKAADTNPATVNIIKVRMTAKQVDKAVESINRVLRIKLKEKN